MGNATPVLVARGVRLTRPARVVGDGHLKLVLGADGGELEAIGFGMGDRLPDLDPALPFDVAFRLDRDEWNGESRLQAKLADLQLHAR
jgi:single-stranded-DNA-specific exonuclease